MHSVLLFLSCLITISSDWIDHHQHLSSLSHRLPYRPNQFGNIWRGNHLQLLWALWILDSILLLDIRWNICCAFVFVVIWIVQVTIPGKYYFIYKMLAGVLSASLSSGRPLSLLIWRTFNNWVRPPGRSFADKAGGKGDLSDNLNVAAPSCWTTDQDALTISSVSQMYPTDVICLFWGRHSFCVANRFWLPWNIYKTGWTLAILCDVLSCTSFFISKSFSMFIVFNACSLPAKILLLARARFDTTTIWRRVSPVVFHCLQPITFRPRVKLPLTARKCRMCCGFSFNWC